MQFVKLDTATIPTAVPLPNFLCIPAGIVPRIQTFSLKSLERSDRHGMSSYNPILAISPFWVRRVCYTYMGPPYLIVHLEASPHVPAAEHARRFTSAWLLAHSTSQRRT